MVLDVFPLPSKRARFASIYGSIGMGWGGDLASANSWPYACAARYPLLQVSEMALCLQLHHRTLSKEPGLPQQGTGGGG